MNGTRVVGVEFNLLRHVLFFDKDSPAERPRLFHARAVVADFDNREWSVHRIPTIAH